MTTNTVESAGYANEKTKPPELKGGGFKTKPPGRGTALGSVVAIGTAKP
jgi:hypothetical protein